jgi:hypothetical protein
LSDDYFDACKRRTVCKKKNTKGTSVLSSLLWVIIFTSSCRKSRTLSNLASLRVKTPVRVQSSEFRVQTAAIYSTDLQSKASNFQGKGKGFHFGK